MAEKLQEPNGFWGDEGSGVAAGVLPQVIIDSGAHLKGSRGSRGRRSRASRATSPASHIIATKQGENGRIAAYKTGDDITFDDLVQFATYDTEFSEEFLKGGKKFSLIQKVGDFIWWAFNKSSSYDEEEGHINAPPGCHISEIKYADRWQLMEVTFKDGTVIVYSRVPSTVFAILKGHAERGDVKIGADGNYHTMMGIAFWDYVRVRGTVHGTQYPAFYAHGAPSGRGSIGAREAAAEGLARSGTQRTGSKGGEVGREAREAARAAAPQKALAFLDEIYNPETETLDVKMLNAIRKGADPDIVKEGGTIAHALASSEFNLDKKVSEAKRLGKELLNFIENTSFLGGGLRGGLLDYVRNPKYEEPWQPLLEMESYLFKHGLWP